MCQTRAAARISRGATSHHQKKPRPGQTRTTPPDLASRACLCPRRSTRGLPFVSEQHKRQREAAHSRSHSAHEEGKERARPRRSDSAGGWRRKAPCSWVPAPQGRCGQVHMTKSKLQHDQPGIRHANCESDTRIGPRMDLDGRPALVVFRGRSRASSPASNEPEGDEHEESHVAGHPSAFSCTANRTISSRNSCHITFFFRATSAGKHN